MQAYADRSTFDGSLPEKAPGTMDEVLTLSEHAYEHALRVARRYARVGNVVVVALVLVVLLALASPAALAPFAVRFAYTRWWRPAYRPPAS